MIRSKYKNTRVEVDGLKFHSKKEATYYGQLKMRKLAGEIYNLFMQVPFELNPGGTFSYRYIADFTFQLSSTDELVVVDVKGFRTSEYKKKKRLMQKVLGITIKEV